MWKNTWMLSGALRNIAPFQHGVYMEKIEKILKSKYFPYLYFCFAVLYCILRNRGVLIAGKELIGGDAQSSYYAINFLKNCYNSGEVPFWNKYLANGTPFLGISYSLFNLYNILCLLFQAEVVYFLEYVVFISMGSTFFYLYLCKIKCARQVSLVFAVIYLLSIHLGGSRTTHLVVIITVTCLPVLLYLIEAYCEKRRFFLVLLMTLVMALQFHNGFMQICLYSDIVVFIYFIVRYIGSGADWKAAVKLCAGWVGIYIALIIGFALPTLYLLMQYSSGTAESSSFSYFITGSIHPIKLFMMFIPELWNDAFTPLAEYGYGTSGMDGEIFLGTLIAILMFTGIVKYLKKDRRIRFSFYFVFASFAFAACASFLPFARLLYKIPVINMFRMPSRTLFIFILFAFIIAAAAMSNIVEDKRYDLLYKACGIYIAVWGLFCMIEALTGLPHFENIYKEGKEIALTAGLFGLVILFLSRRRKNDRDGILLNGFVCIFLMAYTVLQTEPYNRVNEINTKKYLLPVENKMLEEIEHNKILQLSTNDISYVKSIVNYNRALYTAMPTINAELAFNNPVLCKLLSPTLDSTGLLNQTNALAFFKESYNNVALQNDLLSMMGVKYVVDSEKLMEKLELLDRESMETILAAEEIRIDAKEPAVAYAEPVELQENNDYYISFDYECENWDNSVYMDFYGENYDSDDSDMKLELQSGDGNYGIMFSTEDIPDGILCYFRIITNGSTDITFKNIKVTKYSMKENDIYRHTVSGKGFYGTEAVVYENTNARDVLYVPDAVIGMEDSSIIFDYMNRMPLDRTSYVENMKSFTPAKTEISDINWKNNGITAVVKADGPSFVNFSQNFSRDWSVFIDGVEADSVKVNGLIQGTTVPGGIHEIKFRYCPTVMIASNLFNLIAILVVAGIALYLRIEGKKDDR